jgi:predicted transcriptional regulator
MSTIDQILQLLKDGKWHDVNEIAEKTALPQSKIKLAFEFLNEYDFAQLKENNESAKLKPSIIEFVEEIQRLETEEQ